MKEESEVEIIRQSANTLLECNDDFSLIKSSVEKIYQIFSRITGITTDRLNIDKDIMLPSGKAISSAAAAFCLLELKRTTIFLRGINKALIQKIKEKKGKETRILYAGTGPYGTLITPLLSLNNSENIRVDLIDINQDSLTALRKLIDSLGLGSFIGEVHCSDAATIKLNRQYDIVISETMQACLKNEPQLAIMQNLIPQQADTCLFIPEEILIEACLVNPKMENNRILLNNVDQPLRQLCLGEVLRVNKRSLHTCPMPKVINIPPDFGEFPILKLFTTVKVFEEEILSENDSSITLPVTVCDLRTRNADRIKFCYNQNEKPRIECDFISEKESNKELTKVYN